MVDEMVFNKTPVLQRETLLSLLSKYNEDREKNVEHRNAIVEANIGLVCSIAMKYKKIEYQDAVMEGTLGLMTAVDRFDPAREKEFSTYACWWIRQRIGRFIEASKTVRVPAHKQNKIRAFKRAEHALSNSLGFAPNVEELASHLKWTVEEVNRIKLLSLSGNSVSIDASDRKGFAIEGENEKVNVGIDLNDEKRRLLEQIEMLNKRQQFVLTQRFFENKTLEEIGIVLGLTRERVRQIEFKALQTLKVRLGK